jgi:hypothetical protein
MSRIFKKGKNFWIDFCDAEGRRHRQSIGTNPKVAEECLHSVLTKIIKREWLDLVDLPRISFANFAKTWSARVMPTLGARTA